jgi:hypothetical protein
VLFVTCPLQSALKVTVRAATIVGTQTVKIRHADNQPYLIIGTKHIGEIILHSRTDDVILLLTVVTRNADMAYCRLTVTTCRHENIVAGILGCYEYQTRWVVAIQKSKATQGRMVNAAILTTWE